MSAEAYAFTWTYGAASGLRGNQLLVVLCLAGGSKERKAPFLSSLGAEVIAKRIGVTERYVRKILAELLETGHIQLVTQGSGQLANMYQFGHRGVNYSSLQGVNPSSSLFEQSTEVA